MSSVMFEHYEALEQKTNPVNNANFKQGKTVKKLDPFRNSKLNDKILSRSAVGSGIVKSVAKYSLPAYLFFEAVEYIRNIALKMYDEKSKTLGLGKYEKKPTVASPTVASPTVASPTVASPTVASPVGSPGVDNSKLFSPSDIPGVDNPKPILSPDFDPKDTLLSILKDSTVANVAIARQLEASNQIAIQNNKAVLELKSLQNEVDVAYKDLGISSSMSVAKSTNAMSDAVTALSDAVNGIKSIMQDNQEAEVAYKEQALSDNEAIAKHNESIVKNQKALNKTIASIDKTFKNGVSIKKTELENNLLNLQVKKEEFESTPIELDNLGDEIPKLSPQQMRAVKNAVVAKKNSDENTFELDADDIEDMFGMPDISDIFKFNKKTERIKSVVGDA